MKTAVIIGLLFLSSAPSPTRNWEGIVFLVDTIIHQIKNQKEWPSFMVYENRAGTWQ